MRRTSTRSVIGIIATAGLLLAACGDDPESETADSDDTTGVAEAVGGDELDTTDAADDATDGGGDGTDDADEGGSDETVDAPAAGSAVVIVGDERYETSALTCTEATSGTQFGSVADGPRENSQIRGLFGSEILPDLVAVSFDGGSGGEWSALADDGQSTLEDYTFDEDAGTFEGNAVFVWRDAGLEDPDSLTEGTFEVRCD